MTVGELIKQLQVFNPTLEVAHYAESAPRYEIDAVIYNSSKGIVCTCAQFDKQEAIDYGSNRRQKLDTSLLDYICVIDSKTSSV